MAQDREQEFLVSMAIAGKPGLLCNDVGAVFRSKVISEGLLVTQQLLLIASQSNVFSGALWSQRQAPQFKATEPSGQGQKRLKSRAGINLCCFKVASLLCFVIVIEVFRGGRRISVSW